MHEDFDPEADARQLLERNGFDPADPPRPIALAYCELGATRVRRVPFLRSVARWNCVTDTLEIRGGLNAQREDFVVAHELAERVLWRRCWTDARIERCADALAAAILAPAPLVRLALDALGRDLPALAEVFGTSESVAGLRLGEVTGSPVALVTRQTVLVRGEPFGWPDEQQLRLLAGGRREVPHVTRTPLTDAPRRVLLTA